MVPWSTPGRTRPAHTWPTSAIGGCWWSPDGTSLLAERTDRAGVPRWNIADPADPGAGVNTVAYPAAGTTNVAVSLHFLGLDGSRVDVQRGDWEYLAAVHWSAGGP